MRSPLFILFLIVAAVATPDAHIEKRKNVDRPDPTNLKHCPGYSPGDADRCTFEVQKRGPDMRVAHIVGNPVDNCKGGTTDLKTTIGGDISVSQTWKYSVSEGFSASGGEELPAVLVAKVLHKTYTGRIVLNYPDPSGEPGNYHYIWYHYGVGSIQPTDDVIYDQKIVACNQDI
ncbi:hypothetical protein VNI00_012823 [Paramarasmius palmivorus]|uniref:Uncharacterized protein n=1 Tax=Paramarasmius palmivorus TaxID=297713 RepID=A0AAW0C7E8_9AGAR